MKYKTTDNINQATHWLAYEDDREHLSQVTAGRFYPLIWDENEGEHHIEDDRGKLSLVFLTHKGDYIFFLRDISF